MAKYTSDLTRQQVDNTIQSALSMWEKVSPLTFSKVTDGPADIDIIFENKKDKGYSFDGRGGELAYAYFPGSNAGRLIEKLSLYFFQVSKHHFLVAQSLGLHTSLVAHRTRAYPDFCSMKQQG